MKTGELWMLAAILALPPTISSAQNAENPNPYAIFGCTPYVAGAEDEETEGFVIENFAEDSPVARMEHNPRTGRVRLFDTAGALLAEKQLSGNEKAWPTMDKKAEKYYSFSPYAYCAGNPVIYIDPNGESLWISDIESLMAIFNGIEAGQNVTFKMDNGMLDPTSFADVAANSGDFFLQDLLEIARDPATVELSTVDSYSYLNENGAMGITTFDNTPIDDNTKDFGADYEKVLIKDNRPIGRSINGNLGRALFPVASTSRSTNNNIQVRINAKGNINHRTVGIAHEFGHVLLYMKGKFYQHTQPGVDPFVYGRADAMKIRLGYDY